MKKAVILTISLLISLQFFGQEKQEKSLAFDTLVVAYFEASGLKDYYLKKFNKSFKKYESVTAEIDSLTLEAIKNKTFDAQTKPLLQAFKKTFIENYSVSEFKDLISLLQSPEMAKYKTIIKDISIAKYQFGHYVSADAVINKLVKEELIDEKNRIKPASPPPPPANKTSTK